MRFFFNLNEKSKDFNSNYISTINQISFAWSYNQWKRVANNSILIVVPNMVRIFFQCKESIVLYEFEIINFRIKDMDEQIKQMKPAAKTTDAEQNM